MMTVLRTLVTSSALALATAASPIPSALPASAQASSATPVKLWDGFNSPVGMAFDAAGNLYVAEWGAGRVSRIDPAGVRSTFTDGLAGPSGLAIGADSRSMSPPIPATRSTASRRMVRAASM